MYLLTNNVSGKATLLCVKTLDFFTNKYRRNIFVTKIIQNETQH